MRKLVTAAIAAIMLAVVPSAGPAAAFSAPEKISGNAIWSWWTSPTAVLDGSRLHFTGINNTGIQRVLTHDGGKLTYTDLGSENAIDDHNAPALSMSPGQPTLTFYTGHSGTMRYRSAPAGSVDFGAQQTMPFGFVGTYAQVLRDGARVIVLTRRNDNTWQYLRSPDSGKTWSGPQVLFDGSDIGKSYVLLRAFDRDPKTFHVAAYRNPGGTTENLIGYRTITFDKIWAGSDVGFKHDTLQRIWTPPAGRGYRFRLLDVGDKNGRTLVYYARWNEDTPTPQYYTAVREGTSWTSTRIISAGAALYPNANNYVGGISLDRRPGVARLYLSHRDEGTGVWNLVTYRIDSDGQPYLRVVLDTDAQYPLARPVQVGNGLIYQRLLRYANYNTYLSEVWRIRQVDA